MFDTTIVSLATPPLESALAIIRVSGPDSFNILNSLFSKKIEKKRKILHGNILENDEKIDNVIVNTYVEPKSFTGEDGFEIICHGGMYIVDRIISLLISKGAKMAQKGEYSQRAFLNSKIDLMQAEAINDLIRAQSKEEKDIAISSLDKKMSFLVQDLRKSVLDLVSNIEVNIDYPEFDDAEIISKKQAKEKVEEIRKKTKKILNNSKISKLVKEGIEVAIIGKPNVGKSSLLNALLNEDKAIVTNKKGTTRDIVEGVINIDGLKINLLDTAGIRQKADFIEKIGIEKTTKKIGKADLVIAVFDGSKKLDKEDDNLLKVVEKKQKIKVFNKKDILLNENKNKKDYIYVSAFEKNIDILFKKIKEKVGYQKIDFSKKPLLSNARQVGLMQNVEQKLKEVEKEIKLETPIDLISTFLYEVIENLDDILGNKAKTDLNKEIFSRFCLGK